MVVFEPAWIESESFSMRWINRFAVCTQHLFLLCTAPATLWAASDGPAEEPKTWLAPWAKTPTRWLKADDPAVRESIGNDRWFFETLFMFRPIALLLPLCPTLRLNPN
jgi:hypothetical protein